MTSTNNSFELIYGILNDELSYTSDVIGERVQSLTIAMRPSSMIRITSLYINKRYMKYTP